MSKAYPLAALLIYATKQAVTAERIEAVFRELGLECSHKIAAMFELPAERYTAMMSASASTGAVPAPAAQDAGAAAAAAAPAEEEESGDFEIDF